MTKKKSLSFIAYEVLIPVKNDKTAVSFGVGETVTVKDFSAKVIKNWLDITPPVLRIKK